MPFKGEEGLRLNMRAHTNGARRAALAAWLIDEVPGHDGRVIPVQAPVDGVGAMDYLGHESLVDLLDEGVCEVAQVLLARPKLIPVGCTRLLPVIIQGQNQL